MGNHTAGLAMGRQTEMALKMRTNQTAIELLDQICEPWRGHDAEFEGEDPNHPGNVHPDYDNYTDPNGPMGRLIAEAFGEPGHDYVAGWLKGEDEAIDAWVDGPYEAFRARYNFC